jgi:hypothetical protein
MKLTGQALTGELIGLYTVELGGKLENDRKKLACGPVAEGGRDSLLSLRTTHFDEDRKKSPLKSTN